MAFSSTLIERARSTNERVQEVWLYTKLSGDASGTITFSKIRRGKRVLKHIDSAGNTISTTVTLSKSANTASLTSLGSHTSGIIIIEGQRR